MSLKSDTELLCEVSDTKTINSIDQAASHVIHLQANGKNQFAVKQSYEYLVGKDIPHNVWNKIKKFVENDRKICLGLITILGLVLLIASSRNSCCKKIIRLLQLFKKRLNKRFVCVYIHILLFHIVSSEEETGNGPVIVQKVIYIEKSDNNMDATSRRSYSGAMEVVPHKKYDIQLEILLNGLTLNGRYTERISNIKINKISIGQCNLNCESMSTLGCDSSVCTFHDCTPHLTHTTITSGTGIVYVALESQGHTRDCYCGEDTWECRLANRIDPKVPSLKSMYAVARITLIPADG